jgi:acyl dehydratase
VTASSPTTLGPRALFFDDLSVGDSWTSGRRTITEADLVGFAGVSGDFNPLHTDAVFAGESAYGERIAHGALVLSIATGLRQQMGLFDGTLKGLLEIRSWKFLAAVVPGDTVAAVTTILELRPTSSPSQGVVVQRVDVVNQRDHTVQTGQLVTLMRRRS